MVLVWSGSTLFAQTYLRNHHLYSCIKIIWVTSWENLLMLVLLRCRSACTSAQSDQRLVVRCVWQYPKVKNYSDTQTNCCSKFPKYSDIQKICCTVMILSLRTDMPGQTVQTQIRLLRVHTVCHSICIVWTHYSAVEPHTPEPLYNTVCYYTVLDITRIRVGPQIAI